LGIDANSGAALFCGHYARFQGILGGEALPSAARKVAACHVEELEQPETIQEQLVVPRLEIAPPAPVMVENDQRQRRRMVMP